jgi:plastocyanin
MADTAPISKRRLFIVLAIAGLILVTSFLGAFLMRRQGNVENQGSQPATPTPTTMRGTTVHIKNFSFVPERLIVPEGETVTWINDDTVTHTVSANSFRGQHVIEPGEKLSLKTTSFTPYVVGEHAYHCDFHPGMRGMIEVVKAGE